MADDIYVLIEHLQGNVTEMSYILLAAGRELAGGTHGELVGLLLGHNVSGLASNIAVNRILMVDHPALAEYTPDAYAKAIETLLEQRAPRVVLLGETSIGADVAGGLSARLDIPHISLCRSLRVENDKLHFTSQICGGKILADGELPGPTCLVTLVPGAYKAEAGQGTSAPPIEAVEAPALDGLRVSLQGYLEPNTGDVDITREPILVAVGRGLQQEMNLELIQEIAEVLGGELCASRPVVDQGWLSTSRLVGKSGKHVKPKLYLALGISGAPEHTEGIGDPELFLAINTDSQAPIFEVAHYGAAVDLLDLVPVLTEKIKQVKGG